MFAIPVLSCDCVSGACRSLPGRFCVQDRTEVEHLRLKVADLQQELDNERRIHTIAESFHALAVKERDYERIRASTAEARIAAVVRAQPPETYTPEFVAALIHVLSEGAG